MDGTFKIWREPFKQLFTIHAFIKKGDCTKQIPLLYVVMSRRLAIDYVDVFSHILNLLPNKRARVVEAVSDFEESLSLN